MYCLTTTRLLLPILVLLWLPIHIEAQNLVPNYSFETLSSCPTLPGAICEDYTPPWRCPTTGTPDLYHSCVSMPNWYGVPNNNNGYQQPVTGEAYAGMFFRWSSSGGEYMQAPLLSPLVAGVWYHVSFYVSKSDEFLCGIQYLGAYFSTTDFYYPNSGVIDVEPQIESDQGFLMDTADWMLIAGCFQAAGGEAWITIGNFRPHADNPLDPDCPAPSVVYYFVDDVVVEAGPPPEELFLELGGPIEACFNYEIESNHPGPIYHWSDNSNGPTLTVTESGIYSLTVSDGCNIGSDDIEVTILGNIPDIDLGPDSIVLCEGNNYAISLDADFSEYEWNDGSNDPAYVISSPGTYSVTLDDGCATSTDAITVDVELPPQPFTLGDDLLFCNGDAIDLSLDPALGDFIWQDGSTDSNFTITTAGTYSVTISNMCGAEQASISAAIVAPPVVDLGYSSIALCSGEFVELQLDPNMGDIIWQDGSNAANYTITTPGIYSVTITNLCGEDFGQVNVSGLDSPMLDFGPDQFTCTTDPITLTAEMFDADYEWQDNSGGNQFIVTTSGTYALTISNDCGTAIDSIAITYLPVLASPDLGPDVQLCPSESITLFANPADATVLWNDLSNADSLLINTAGVYWLQLSNSCGIVADTINVTVNSDPPSVDLPSQLQLCAGSSVTLDAAITGVRYLWNDNSQNQQLIVNTPGIYSLTVTNSCGSDIDSVVVFDGGPAPLVDLGNDISLCPGEQSVILPVFSDVDNWLWQDGSTLDSMIVTGNGTITVAVTNACGSGYDTLQVQALPAIPTVDLGTDTALCTNESIILFLDIPDVQIMWQDGSTSPDFTITAPGTSYVTISNACGTSADTIVIEALPEIPALDLGQNQSLCPGELITFSPGIDDVDYFWQDGSDENQFSATQPGTIILIISNACGVSTDTVVITESTEGPDVDLGPDVAVCEGEIITIDAGISGVDYLWQDGSTEPGLITDVSGTFILQVSNNCGSDTDTIVVDISGTSPVVSLGADTLLCDDATLNLHVNPEAGTSVIWQDGSTGTNLLITSEGTYSVTASNECGVATDSITITQLNSPAPFALGPDTILCPNQSIVLVVPATTNAWTWNDDSMDSVRTISSAGVYSLLISNSCGEALSSTSIQSDDRIPFIELDSLLLWCIGETISLDASQSFPATYAWSTDESSPAILIAQPGLYHVEVAAPCASDAMTIAVEADPDCRIQTGIYIPNIFSPNGDSVNDVFTVHPGADITMTGSTGTIYDRWGNVVYSSTDIPFVWDGHFNQQPMMPGVYVYRIALAYEVVGQVRSEILAGDVTLLR
jgi:gliding motility-associated-like protein